MEATTPAYPTQLSNAQWAILAVYFAADYPVWVASKRLRLTELHYNIEIRW